MTSGIWDAEAIRNCTHECEYAPPTPRLSTSPTYSDFPVARALQGRPHVRRSRAADEHRTPLQNEAVIPVAAAQNAPRERSTSRIVGQIGQDIRTPVLGSLWPPWASPLSRSRLPRLQPRWCGRNVCPWAAKVISWS